nr:zinc finger protein 622 [Hymenolepis microstoma]
MSCQTCQVRLNDVDIKKHLHSDWHIYNLRRSLAALPPLAEEVFLQKEELFRLSNNGNTSKSSIKNFYCEICKKNFKSNNAYECHIASQQHLKKMKFIESEKIPSPVEVIEEISRSEDAPESEHAPEEFSPSEFGKPLPVGSCLFCETTYHGNPDAVECVLSHMINGHNFTIPYPEKLANVRGLLENLGRLVGEEFICLGCGRQFLGPRQNRHKKSLAELRKQALSAVRKHMMDKQHNFLYTGVEDPVIVSAAVAEAGVNEKTVVPPIARVGGELYSHYYSGDRANKTLVLPDSESKFTEEETYEVHLPSGGVIGHRRYFQTVFRQNPYAHLELPSTSRVSPATLSWKARPGIRAVTTLSESEIARLSLKEDRDRRADLKRRSRQEMKLGIRGNTVLAKHFRAAQ